MPVVSNTSPILNLALVERLALLKEQFGQVLIPQAVLDELRIDEPLPGVDLIRESLAEGWVQVKGVSDRHLVRILSRELDDGESEAIALAIEVHADTILLDEREARIVARSLGLNITGVLGVLLKAHRMGRLQASLAEAIYELQTKAHFYVAEPLVRQVLEEVSEEEIEIWVDLQKQSR